MVCMSSLLSSNGRDSAYFDCIRLQVPEHAYSEVRFYTMLSKYENSNDIFCDIITDELYFQKYALI